MGTTILDRLMHRAVMLEFAGRRVVRGWPSTWSPNATVVHPPSAQSVI